MTNINLDSKTVLITEREEFLNQQGFEFCNETVQWQYTLGLVGLYDFWNPEKKSKKIPYAQLDAILRTLGQMQFTGYTEWAAVVAINKYFEPLHNAYVDATEKTYDIASKHQAVMQKMEEIQKGEVEQKAEDKKEPEA